MKLTEKYKSLFEKYNINTDLRVAHFMAQIEHESGFRPIGENLNYSSQGLIQTFSKYFTTEESVLYARNPQKIANRVYADRMGNGNEASGDGWKYRGRGFIQITGKDNYTALSISTCNDYLSKPDLLLTEADSLISALWYWKKTGLNKLADEDNLKEITRRINGGYNGLVHRIELLKKWKNATTKPK